MGYYDIATVPFIDAPSRVSDDPTTSTAFNDIVLLDHRDAVKCHQRVKALAASAASESGGGGDESTLADLRRWTAQLVWLVMRHSKAEELVMYPEMEKMGGESRKLAKEGEKAHEKVEEAVRGLVKEMEAVGSKEFMSKLDDVMEELKAHMAQEETEDLVLMKKQLDEERMTDLGEILLAVKRMEPIHARPTPGKPQKQKIRDVMEMMAGPMDELRESLGEFPSPKEVKEVLRADMEQQMKGGGKGEGAPGQQAEDEDEDEGEEDEDYVYEEEEEDEELEYKEDAEDAEGEGRSEETQTKPAPPKRGKVFRRPFQAQDQQGGGGDDDEKPKDEKAEEDKPPTRKKSGGRVLRRSASSPRGGGGGSSAKKSRLPGKDYDFTRVPAARAPCAVASNPATSTSLIDALLVDHREVQLLFEHVRAQTQASGGFDAAEARRWLGQLLWAMTRHSVAEQEVLYAEMEESGRDELVPLAEEARRTHEEVDKLVLEIVAQMADTRETEFLFMEKVEEAMELLAEHINHEETVELQEMKKVMSEDEQQEAGELFMMVKRMQPTNARPVLASREPKRVVEVVEKVAIPLDKLRKQLISFPSPIEVKRLLLAKISDRLEE